MGSSMSCLRPRKEEGPIRPVPDRRPVSASELQRAESSFSASTSFTLEPKRRQSVEVERPPSPNVEPIAVVETTEVVVSSIKKLLPAANELKEEEVENVENTEEEDESREEYMPIAGSTSDDIGATGDAETAGLVDMHVRADKALVTATRVGEETAVKSTSQLPDKAPSLESMPASLVDDRLTAKGKEDIAVEVRKDRARKVSNAVNRKGTKNKKQELQRSDTMLDVRNILPVQTHVTNYEKIDAEAKVDPEEMVKSGKYKTVDA